MPGSYLICQLTSQQNVLKVYQHVDANQYGSVRPYSDKLP